MLKNALTNLNVFALALLLMQAGYSAEAAQWGSIKGRIVLDAAPAKLPPLGVNKDQFCIDKQPVNEAIIVGKENALANAFVYVRLPTGQTIDVHPNYAAKLNVPVLLDNKGCAFQTHALTIRVGQELNMTNSDPVGHNTNIISFAFNQIIDKDKPTTIKAQKDGALPTEFNCNIHPWMKGFLLCQKHPYMMVTGDDGKFEIKDIPVGEHNFQFWHEAGGYLKDVKVAGVMTDRKGQAKLTIKAGETIDLGDLTVKASTLRP